MYGRSSQFERVDEKNKFCIIRKKSYPTRLKLTQQPIVSNQAK
jgi:hypothetical protein